MDRMQSEIVTDPLRGTDLRNDLEGSLAQMKALGLHEVALLFGFSWGNHIYEKEWKEIPVSPEDALSLVQSAEKKGFGQLGEDNLYLIVPKYNLRLLYSHEADIHLSFAEPNRLVYDIVDRWNAMQWLCYNKSKVLENVLRRSG